MNENENGLAGKRFSMVKKRHAKTLDDAISCKKADELMIPLCRFISETKNYFTSSSCAGRIMLLDVLNEESKKDSSFHRKWHREVGFEELLEGINAKSNGMLWMRVEPFIMHLGCKDLEHAEKLLGIKNKAGIKRGGIILAGEGKFMIELTGTQYLSVPVKDKGSVLVDESYLKILLGIANRKIAANYKRLEKFHALCKRHLE